MELPTVQANEHATTNPSASNSVFSNLQGCVTLFKTRQSHAFRSPTSLTVNTGLLDWSTSSNYPRQNSKRQSGSRYRGADADRRARRRSGIAAAPVQDPEQRSPNSLNWRYPYKQQRHTKKRVVIVGVGRCREHSDEAA